MKTQKSLLIDRLIGEAIARNPKQSIKDLQGDLVRHHHLHLGESAIKMRKHRLLTEEKPVITYQAKKIFNEEKSSIRKEADKLIEENKLLKDERDVLLALKKQVHTIVIKPSVRGGSSEAVAVVLLSDFHLGETVVGSTINGLNEFNPEIAEQRVIKCFQSIARLLEIFGRDIPIKKVIIMLGGDFISNQIHDELMETNSMRPIEEAIFAQRLLASGIKFLLHETHQEYLFVCKSGNHGRITRKPRNASEAGNSIEYMMYCTLAQMFSAEKRTSWNVETSYHTYVDVFGMTLRFHHGHNIRYFGGIGGLTIPCNKAIAQWNNAKKADIDLFGHFHSAFDGGIFLCNGSLIGYNAYAVSIKAPYEKPKQMMFLIDNKRGKTIVAPIIL